MKVDLKMAEKFAGKKVVHFKRGPGARKSQLVFPPLSPSVNPLFRLAHHAQFYFTSPSALGGQK